ncbi:hypothetical protein ALC57_08746 [Trachymyrmex cornetzi]|uniref:Odorant receptor 13a n=1 Tax=Trachymyrmex cornetzi TaxID=471704 RepID=A0A195E189_9HYME|nr:hypothetical protein ALC57_08746 [Trachymyrmex cornetzi]
MCSYVITLTSLMINMFMFCYTGEQLTVQAERVASTSCELEWYRLPDKKARGIVLVIIMSNMPTKVTAGKIMDLSFKTYGDKIFLYELDNIYKAEEVARKSCVLEWYRLPNKDARGIVLIIIMSNLPAKITSGKIVDLSLKTYGDAEEVARTSCMVEWYRLPNKDARGIVLVIIMSNLPTKITAGNIMDLSLKTYGDEWEDHNVIRLCAYISVLIMFCFNIFIYCYMGEQIIEQGEKVALTTRTLEWYRLPDTKARALILLIIISENPLNLKAGNLIDISLRTFGNEWEDHNVFRLSLYFSGLSMFCFNIFIYCYMGEQIIEQGEKIALTACTLEWHRLPDVKARALILLISISEKPLRLKAGNFIDLTLRTFGNVKYRKIFVKIHTEMPQNKHHQNDILYITQPTRNILLALGAWPFVSKRRSIYPKAHNLLLICISYIFLSSDIIPGVLYWLMAETARVRLQTIPLLLYDFMSVSQYGIFIFRYDKLRRCLQHIEEDWKNVLSVDARNIMLKSARTGKRLVTICAIFMYSGAFTFRTILPLFQGKIAEKVAIASCELEWYRLPDKKARSVVLLIIMNIGTLCSYLISIINVIIHMFLFCYTGEQLTGQAEKVAITSCVLEWYRLPDKKARSVILLIIMSNMPTKISAGQFIDLSLKTFGNDWESRNIATVCTYCISITNVTIHTFLFCYTGEQLTSQAEKVAIASCELEWFRLPDKKARSIILLIRMSNAPTKISAGIFVDLSLKTFGNIMKTAGTYFNMIRNVID